MGVFSGKIEKNTPKKGAIARFFTQKFGILFELSLSEEKLIVEL
jgi:hypothetical protein